MPPKAFNKGSPERAPESRTMAAREPPGTSSRKMWRWKSVYSCPKYLTKFLCSNLLHSLRSESISSRWPRSVNCATRTAKAWVLPRPSTASASYTAPKLPDPNLRPRTQARPSSEAVCPSSARHPTDLGLAFPLREDLAEPRPSRASALYPPPPARPTLASAPAPVEGAGCEGCGSGEGGGDCGGGRGGGGGPDADPSDGSDSSESGSGGGRGGGCPGCEDQGLLRQVAAREVETILSFQAPPELRDLGAPLVEP
mmetsp:Transcript_23379/g.67659  ORF Transcript_23379/g.67659 Transcript_23379/m.67659 type:complete len:255 (+) Transcript_23379:822-1586(+)